MPGSLRQSINNTELKKAEVLAEKYKRIIPTPQEIFDSICWRNFIGAGRSAVFRIDSHPGFLAKIDDHWLRIDIERSISFLFEDYLSKKEPTLAECLDLSGIPELGVHPDSFLRKKLKIEAPELTLDPALDGERFGQKIASYGEQVTLLQFEKGMPSGLPAYWGGTILEMAIHATQAASGKKSEAKSPLSQGRIEKFAEDKYMEIARITAGMPLQAYTSLFRQYARLGELGYVVDFRNSNNLLIDAIHGEFRLIDLERADKVHPEDYDAINKSNPIILWPLISAEKSTKHVKSAEAIEELSSLKRTMLGHFMDAYEQLECEVKLAFLPRDMEDFVEGAVSLYLEEQQQGVQSRLNFLFSALEINRKKVPALDSSVPK